MDHTTVFQAIDNADQEFNVLQAAIEGLVDVAAAETDAEQQIVVGVNYQMMRTGKAIQAVFDSLKENKAAA